MSMVDLSRCRTPGRPRVDTGSGERSEYTRIGPSPVDGPSAMR